MTDIWSLELCFLYFSVGNRHNNIVKFMIIATEQHLRIGRIMMSESKSIFFGTKMELLFKLTLNRLGS